MTGANEISKETKIVILKNEIATYDNTIYLLGVRLRLAKKLKDKQMEDAVNTELINIQIRLDFLNEELEKEFSNTGE